MFYRFLLGVFYNIRPLKKTLSGECAHCHPHGDKKSLISENMCVTWVIPGVAAQGGGRQPDCRGVIYRCSCILTLHGDVPAAVVGVFHLPPFPLNGDTSLENFNYRASKTVAISRG